MVRLSGLDKPEAEDKKDSDLKACSSVSGLNGWVPIAETGCNVFEGKFYNSIIDLSISRSVLATYAVVSSTCFVRSGEGVSTKREHIRKSRGKGLTALRD